MNLAPQHAPPIGDSRLFHSRFTGRSQDVGAIARQSGAMEAAQHEHEVLHIGDLEIRPDEGLCLAGGTVLALSVREFGLLVALARRAGRIVRREDLYRLVWDASLREGDRTVDVYVHKLRSKLEAALPEHRFIHTHVGFGYRFAPERSHAFHT